jgi:hypothetical protein
MYSEYDTKHSDNDDWHKQVSVWEQNHDGQHRNHKYWDVVEPDFTLNSKGIKITNGVITTSNNAITQ